MYIIFVRISTFSHANNKDSNCRFFVDYSKVIMGPKDKESKRSYTVWNDDMCLKFAVVVSRRKGHLQTDENLLTNGSIFTAIWKQWRALKTLKFYLQHLKTSSERWLRIFWKELVCQLIFQDFQMNPLRLCQSFSPWRKKDLIKRMRKDKRSSKTRKIKKALQLMNLKVY